jgi:hypothetical protein
MVVMTTRYRSVVSGANSNRDSPVRRGLPTVVAVHLEKAKKSAVGAVDCYNRSGTKFRSGSYIVLMCIAWTSLFHAVFKRKQKPFYRNKQNPKRFVVRLLLAGTRTAR